MIDLHCHSRCSDGELSPAALAERAHARGVRVLALSDHDTTDGCAVARAAAPADLRILTSVEISVDWAGKEVHIVGLDVDPEQADLRAGLQAQQARRWSRLAAMSDKLALEGIEGVEAAVRAMPDVVSPGRQHLARELVARGVVKDAERAFARYVGRKGSAWVRPEWCALQDAVGWIRAAGGLPVLAHPGRYDFSGGALKKLLTAFAEAGGLGLEVSYPQLFIKEAQRLAGLARSAGLLASQGSDFHSPEQRWTDLGRMPPLPPAIEPIWSLRPEWLADVAAEGQA